MGDVTQGTQGTQGTTAAKAPPVRFRRLAVTSIAGWGRWARRRMPSPATAALRSALVPGWGQWAAGRRRRGLVLTGLALLSLLLPMAALLAVAQPLLPLLPLPGAIQPPLSAAASALHAILEPTSGWLRADDWGTIWRLAAAINISAALFRAWAALDAARCARRPRGPFRSPSPPHWLVRRVLPAMAATPAGLLILAPHLGFAAAAYVARPLLAQVLVPRLPLPPPPRPAPAPESNPAPADVTESVQLPDHGRPVWDGRSRLNVLLIGSDRRPDEAAMQQWGNSDTILLVSIDPTRQAAAIISVPRDMYLQYIPGLGPAKVNAAYSWGGPELALRVVNDLLGVPIHRWASVDVAAFTTVLDALGGVVVDVEHPIRDDEYPTEDYAFRRIFIPAGLQWLDGERAIWYVRSRHGSSDFDRASRQQHLLLALKARARDPSVLPRLPALIMSLASAVQTDISPREALVLAGLGATGDLGTVRGLVLTPPEYGREVPSPQLYYIVPNLQRIRQGVNTLLSADPAAPVTQVPPGTQALSVLPLNPSPTPAVPAP